MNRPCVVLAQRARQLTLTKLGPRLIDARKQELALALLYSHVVAVTGAGGGYSNRRGDDGRPKDDIDQSHVFFFRGVSRVEMNLVVLALGSKPMPRDGGR